MNDATIVSDNQAALLDAQAMSEALAERYQQASEHCEDNAELHQRMKTRARALESLASELSGFIKTRELMPKDSHGERQDLAQLFDAVRGLVDDSHYQRLREALAEQEEQLVEHLDTFTPRDDEKDTVTRGKQEAQAALAWIR